MDKIKVTVTGAYCEYDDFGGGGWCDFVEGDLDVDLQGHDESTLEATALIRGAMREWLLDEAESYPWVTSAESMDLRLVVDGETEDYTYPKEFAEFLVEPDEEIAASEAGLPSDCNHEWEGVGGCDENPGVFSTGGTSLLFKSECNHCGWTRTETFHGACRNPGTCDKIMFESPY